MAIDYRGQRRTSCLSVNQSQSIRANDIDTNYPTRFGICTSPNACNSSDMARTAALLLSHKGRLRKTVVNIRRNYAVTVIVLREENVRTLLKCRDCQSVLNIATTLEKML